MERERILDTVIRHLRVNVEDLTPDTAIDPAKSMIDYGATSLDIVEIVSYSMHELGLKIPRTEFANLANIDDLVDLFAKHLEDDEAGWVEGEL